MKLRYLLLFLLSINLLQAKTCIFSIGDSTMADYDTVKYSGENEQRGWGQLFPALLDKRYTLVNKAKNGRSSKSFYYEIWKQLRNELQSGDMVFIQFGHNDEKADGLDTDVNDTTARGTAAQGQYKIFLRKYVNESRERGAVPVLFTPVVRRYFDKNGKLTDKALHNLAKDTVDNSMDYVLAMKQIAKELNVPLIDMTELTKELVESYGPEKSKSEIYVIKDDTHLKENGASLFAKLAFDELIRQEILKK